MPSNDWSTRQDGWVKPFIAGAVMSYATFNLLAYKRRREYRRGERPSSESDFSILDHYSESYRRKKGKNRPVPALFRTYSPTHQDATDAVKQVKATPQVLEKSTKPNSPTRDKSEGSASTSTVVTARTTNSQATNIYDNRTTGNSLEELARQIRNAEKEMMNRVSDLIIVIEKSPNRSIVAPSPFYIGGGDNYYDNYVTTLVQTLEALGIRQLWFVEPPREVNRPMTSGSGITLDSSLNSFVSRRNSLIKRHQRVDMPFSTGDGSASNKKKVLIVVDKELVEETEAKNRSKRCFVRNKKPSSTPSIRSLSPIRSQDTVEPSVMSVPPLEQREFRSTKECIDTLVLEGYTLWCTGTDMSHQDSISLTQEDIISTDEFDNMQSNEIIPKKLAIVFGTNQGTDDGLKEGVGCFCSEEMRDASAKRIYQPLLRGLTDSSTLNLSVITTLVVHQLFTIYPTLVGSTLPTKEKVKLRERWYAKLSSQQRTANLKVPRSITSPQRDSQRLSTLMKLREERESLKKTELEDDDSSSGDGTVAESTVSSSDMSEGNEKLPGLRTRVLDLEDNLELKIHGLRNLISR